MRPTTLGVRRKGTFRPVIAWRIEANEPAKYRHEQQVERVDPDQVAPTIAEGDVLIVLTAAVGTEGVMLVVSLQPEPPD